MSARWSRQFVVLLVCLAGAGVVPEVATGSPETSAYLGQQPRHAFDGFQLADRARLTVNVANGNLVVTFDDVRIAGRGLDLALSRSYNARSNTYGQYGFNWTSSLGNDNQLGGLPNQDQTWTGPTGATFTFTKQPNGSFVSPPGINGTLDSAANTLTFHRTATRLQFVQETSVSKKLTKVIDRNNNEITLTYDGNRVSKVTDTQGRVLTFAYDTGGNLDSITDPTGRQWLYAHDSSHRLTSYTDPGGKVWTYRYDASGRLDKITDPRLNETLIGYDTTDRVSSVTRRVDGTTANDVTTTYSYPTVSAPCTSGTHAFKTLRTDPRGKVTTYCADGQRQVTRGRNAVNQDFTQSYNANGDLSGYSDLVGTGQAPQATFTFDNSTNNLTGGTLGAGETFSQKFCGQAGEPTCASLGFGTAAYAPTRYVDTEGADTLFGYDARGNMTDVKDAPTPKNRATLTYNADGTIATATDGRGNTTTFAYHTAAGQAGNLKTITHPATSAPGAALGAFNYTFDSLGRVRTILDPRGVVMTYTYDNLDRVTGVSTSGGGPYVLFTYDANGNLTQRLSSTAGTTTFGYDKLNRRTSDGFPGGLNNTYGYDKASNLTSVVDPSGTVTHTYDDINRIATVVAPNAAGTGTDTVTYTYTDTPSASDPTTKVTATYPGGATQRTDRNGSGRIARVVVRNSSGTVLSSREYSYRDSTNTARWQIQSVTNEANVKTAYTYEDAVAGEDVGRLLKARTETGSGALVEEQRFEYDASGNRTQRTRVLPSQTIVSAYAYNQANQLCWRGPGPSSATCGSPPSGVISYLYDAAGNQLAGDQGTQSMSYDNLGRVSALGGTAIQSFGETTAELKSWGTRNFHNTLLGLSREWVGTNVTSIVRNPDTGLPVSERQSGTKRYFLQDAIGSTTGMLDATSGGSIAVRFTYSPDGAEDWTGSGPVTNIRFAGGYRMPNAFLYHFGERFYDFTTARWTQLDPLPMYPDMRQANRYVYVGGDPINLIDPFGRSWIGDALEIGGMVVGTAVLCGTAASGVGAAACVGGLMATTGVIANKAEGWGKARRRNRR